ncbi:LPXTG cell wall anchor domain-containing protein [Asanoa siamensis]|uniref:LPXTG-motif cell wall-anchored protein n=1 Tax=Asanoa siamensis TaxID=926357 RepID=A0ABQ4CLP4_9ACTN|nr:LPXTG cell wall anchor domain-containing protein [Asanoa siamensis]GIF72193.1 hypothetical protein Asi02nite_17110 [Asanoa siamensis]
MRWKIAAGVLVALAFMVPAAPAAAQTQRPGLNESCQTVERKIYKDMRELVKIDLDTANTAQVRLLANQILFAATNDQLSGLSTALQGGLNGPADDLRAFLKTDLQNTWFIDLRLRVNQTMTGAGTNVRAAAQKALDAETIDALLAYLNEDMWAARARDCAATPSPNPSATPTTTPTAGPSPVTSGSPAAPGGEGGGLPVTGANTAILAGAGGALLLVGAAVFVIGRRRRARFVA